MATAGCPRRDVIFHLHLVTCELLISGVSKGNRTPDLQIHKPRFRACEFLAYRRFYDAFVEREQSPWSLLMQRRT